MKDDKNLQNKAVRPAENKDGGLDTREVHPETRGIERATRPPETLARVRVKPGRAVNGIGGAGTEASISEQEAQRLAAIGYVEIIKET